jgi:hypothetical protein
LLDIFNGKLKNNLKKRMAATVPAAAKEMLIKKRLPALAASRRLS